MAVEPSVQHESVSCPYVNDQSHCFVCPTPHSPESMVPQPVVHKEKCGGGGEREKKCPHASIHLFSNLDLILCYLVMTAL